MAIELARVISANGGSIYINATVSEILIEQNQVKGVRMADGQLINAQRVVSGAGYARTFQSLVSESVSSALEIPRTVPGVPQSAGFVMINIGASMSRR